MTDFSEVITLIITIILGLIAIFTWFSYFEDYVMEPYNALYHEANCHSIKKHNKVDHTHRCDGY